MTNLHNNTINGIIKQYKETGRYTLNQRKTQYFKMYERSYFDTQKNIEVLDLNAFQQEYEKAICGNDTDYLIFDNELLARIKNSKQSRPKDLPQPSDFKLFINNKDNRVPKDLSINKLC